KIGSDQNRSGFDARPDRIHHVRRGGSTSQNVDEALSCCSSPFRRAERSPGAEDASTMRTPLCLDSELFHVDDLAVARCVEVGKPRFLGKPHALIKASRRRVAI